jgi:ADP-ribose pyrophosphatase YjhB (NUDIX family)
MHEIQKYILHKLMFAKDARYSELKPEDVEGNLFSYHMNILKKEGQIETHAGKYRLTAGGKRHAIRLSSSTLVPRIQPTIVTMVVLKHKGKYLLHKRTRLPFIGKIGFPYGKIHLEERVKEAAERELLEKAGLKADLKHCGDVYLTIHNETELVSHMLCHVFSGSKIEGEPQERCFWGMIGDYSNTDLIPGTLQIEKMLKKEKGFFFGEWFLNCGE